MRTVILSKEKFNDIDESLNSEAILKAYLNHYFKNNVTVYTNTFF